MTQNPMSLDEVFLSLRLADDRINDVLARLPERLDRLRDIAAPFLGDQTARETQYAAVLRKAEELSESIAADRSTLGQVQQELGSGRYDLEQTLAQLGGRDDDRTGRLIDLRNLTDDTVELVTKADQRLGQVQEGLGALRNEQRLSRGMSATDQSRGVRDVGVQGAEDLAAVTESLNAGRDRLDRPRDDQELMIAQKGFNPTGREDQRAVADQGSNSSAARINGISAALDGWDRD